MGDIDIIIKSLDPLRAHKNIHKKEVGPYHGFGYGYSRNHGIAQLLRMYDIDFCDF